MQFMFQYPDVHGPDADMLDAGPVTELAQTAERAGWNGISFTEHPAPGAKWLASGGHQTLDPFVALGAAAAVTTKLKLLTYLAVVPYRNPMLLAKSAATVDKLSGGRMILGVGTGYLKGEFRSLGVDFDERNELFDEALDVLPLHWAGEAFSYEGKHFNARDIIARPRPVQQPIPIWIGGNAKITLQRVAERAQGWMPLTGPAEMATTARSPHLDSIESIKVRLDMLKDMAGDRFGTLDLAISYSDPSLHLHGVDVQRHADAFAAYRDLGATWIVIAGPTGKHPLASDFVQEFGAQYLNQ